MNAPTLAIPQLDAVFQELRALRDAVATLTAKINPTKALYSTDEFAAEVCCTEWSVRKWCRTGQVQGTKDQDSGCWKVPYAELQRYKQRCRPRKLLRDGTVVPDADEVPGAAPAA